MKIQVSIDNTRLLSRLRKSETRIAFAVVNALNATGKKIVEAERARVLRDFTVRDHSPNSFLLRNAAVVTQSASVGRGIPFVEVSTNARGRLLLPEFETGGPRRPFKGKNVAIPVVGGPARPAFVDPVAQAFKFSDLRFTKTRPLGPVPAHGRRRRSRKSSGEGVRFGAQDTFLIPGVGVFQRTGRAASVLVWAFVQAETLPKRPGFAATAQAAVEQWWGPLLDEEIARTLARHANE